MRFFDTHCHFDVQNPAEIAAILARARAAGVEKLMAVGGSPEMNASARQAQGLGNGERGTGVDVVSSFGYDMGSVDWERPTASVDAIVRSFGDSIGTPAAIGEIGLDYHYYGPETRAAQQKLFAVQLEAARQRDLPVVVHTREAAADTLALLKEIPSRGIIHCFTGTPDEARGYLELGFFVSFSGIVTFRAADNVRQSARFVPDDRILIETDSPFLAPVPMRGRPNEPAFVRLTCEFLAALRSTAAETFADLTFSNAERVLRPRPPNAPDSGRPSGGPA